MYDTSDPWISSKERYQYVGDTVVDGFQSQRIERLSMITELWGTDTSIVSPGAAVITRTTPGVVYSWMEDVQEWDTLHWFSAIPGDRWSPAGWAQQCGDELQLVVLDTFSIVIEGIPLRHLSVQRFYSGEPLGTPSIVSERIGSTSEYFMWDPQAPCAPINECFCTFSCYRDVDLEFPLSGADCSLPTSTEGTQTFMDIGQIVVRPIAGSIYHLIHAPRDRSGRMRILDTSGRIIQEQVVPIGSTLQEVDLSQHGQGTYLCILQWPEEMATMRIVR